MSFIVALGKPLQGMVSLGLVIVSSEDVEVKKITSGIMTKA